MGRGRGNRGKVKIGADTKKNNLNTENMFWK